MPTHRSALLVLLLAAALGCSRAREATPNKDAQGVKGPPANEKEEDETAAKYNKARADLETLTKAVQAYKVAHKEYPKTLAELTKKGVDGSPALLKPEALTDPWGGTYVLDTSKPQPRTGTPLIYTPGPYKDKEQGRIPNWK
jgi:Type II secretion system (T2SS), protein G